MTKSRTGTEVNRADGWNRVPVETREIQFFFPGLVVVCYIDCNVAFCYLCKRQTVGYLNIDVPFVFNHKALFS